MRAAIPTEAQLAPVTALRYLHVALGHAPQQHKGAFHGWHGCAKRAARQGLTIGAVANNDIVGIHHCFVANLARGTASQRLVPTHLKSLPPDEYARDQYDFAGYIDCLHRHLAIVDGSRVDLSDPVSRSRRDGQIPFLELPSRSRST